MSKQIEPGLVSAVVASYNHARYLPRRMDSLIGQTHAALEILVIDDCSPDNSREVLAAYRGAPRVTLLDRQTNGGWVAVSNQGIELTGGEYVLFANCDDFCDPRMIERLVAALAAHPTAGVAFCRSIMVDEHDRAIGDDFHVREKAFRDRCAADAFLTGDEMRRFLMHSCVIPNLSAALIRRSCFDAVGVLVSDYKACSDWELFFRIADHFDFCYVAEPLNSFRQHARSIRSATKGRITYDEFFRVLLGRIGHPAFTAAERSRFRLHTMYLWAVELMQPATAGLVNFPHHARMVAGLDPVALAYLPLALLRRGLELPAKALARLSRRLRRRQDGVASA